MKRFLGKITGRFSLGFPGQIEKVNLERIPGEILKDLRGNSRKNPWRNFGKISELCRAEIYGGITEIPGGIFEIIAELFSGEICLEKCLGVP